jgi:hypothetical protein
VRGDGAALCELTATRGRVHCEPFTYGQAPPVAVTGQ